MNKKWVLLTCQVKALEFLFSSNNCQHHYQWKGPKEYCVHWYTQGCSFFLADYKSWAHIAMAYGSLFKLF